VVSSWLALIAEVILKEGRANHMPAVRLAELPEKIRDRNH